MRKIVLIILTIISFLIILSGFLIAKNTKNELAIESIPKENIYVDGTNMTNVTEAFNEIGSGLLGVVIIVYSFSLVGVIWGIYAIVLVIKLIYNKKKNKVEENMNNSILNK